MKGVTSVTVSVPLTIRRRPGRRTMVSLPFEDAAGRISTKADPALVKALARAFRYQKLRTGSVYLNSPWAFPKCIPALVRPPSGLMAAR